MDSKWDALIHLSLIWSGQSSKLLELTIFKNFTSSFIESSKWSKAACEWATTKHFLFYFAKICMILEAQRVLPDPGTPITI